MNPFSEALEYQEGKLYWKVNTRRKMAGAEAGTVCRNGRRYIQLNGKKYLSHRIVWFLQHGSFPEFIDHIDGNPLNNRLENLRVVTKSQNAMNRKVMSTNSTGLKGVIPKASGKFVASICVEGKNKYLGIHDTKEAAHMAYKAAAHTQFKEFAKW